MKADAADAHPYMPNSLPAIKAEMLQTIGAASVRELFEQIPEDHRLRKPLDLPPAIRSESPSFAVIYTTFYRKIGPARRT